VISEGRFTVTLDSILATPKGSGLGTKLVWALKDYADQTGKTLQVEQIENSAFFERFDFWSDYFWPESGQDGEATYCP
jgi:hypothetical protein